MKAFMRPHRGTLEEMFAHLNQNDMILHLLSLSLSLSLSLLFRRCGLLIPLCLIVLLFSNTHPAFSLAPVSLIPHLENGGCDIDA